MNPSHNGIALPVPTKRSVKQCESFPPTNWFFLQCIKDPSFLTCNWRLAKYHWIVLQQILNFGAGELRLLTKTLNSSKIPLRIAYRFHKHVDIGATVFGIFCGDVVGKLFQQVDPFSHVL